MPDTASHVPLPSSAAAVTPVGAASPVPVRAVLWDFGGVILTSPFDAFRAYEREAGVPADTIRTINATNPDTNAWARFERSEVDADGFAALFEAEARALGHALDAHRVLALLHGKVRPEMVVALDRIKAAGLLQACCTNNVHDANAQDANAHDANAHDANAHDAGPRPEVAAVMARFDAVIESRVVGVRKPDPQFYRLALEALDVRAEEAVFLDDLGINLKPAAAMGIRTIKVTDPTAALAALEAHLGIALS